MAIDLFSIGKFTVHGYGLLIGLGFLAIMLLGSLKAKKLGLSVDHFTNIGIWVLLIGFLGGKILFLIVEFKTFITNPLSVIRSEGFVVYGGVITGILTIYVYCAVKKLVFRDYFDVVATYVPLNQAFGRLGCFMAGCCYGRQTDAWYGVIFPEGALAPAGVKLVPTQLMMAAGDLIIFLLMLLFERYKKTKGMAAGVYLLMYSIGRFIIEFFRNDVRGSVGTLSTSQFIAIWMALAAIVYMVVLKKFIKAPVESAAEDAVTEGEEAHEEA